LQAFLQRVGPQKALAGAIALLALSLLALSLAIVWYGLLSSRQEAAEQAMKKEETTAPPALRPEDFPLIFNSGSSPERAEVNSASGRSRGIPGFADMDLIGTLQYLPSTNFSCPGPTPDQGLYRWTCTSSRRDDPAVYEVTVVEESPSSVLWVQTHRPQCK
jgi:hypothetical protein